MKKTDKTKKAQALHPPTKPQNDILTTLNKDIAWKDSSQERSGSKKTPRDNHDQPDNPKYPHR